MKKALVVLALVLLPTLASADTIFDRCFSSLDTDENGTVSHKELKQAYPEKAGDVLKKADTDKSGDLSHDEWENFKAGLGIRETS